MKASSPSDGMNSHPHIALLWDESFLWGVMAYKALAASGYSFDLVRSKDVKSGGLKKYAVLFVPGGWASNKMKALGSDGVEEIKKFVFEGGAYFGLCGGAGLATQDGIGLVAVKRRPTKERVPSFSGRIKLRVYNHPLWRGVPEGEDVKSERTAFAGSLVNADAGLRTQHAELIFNAWWPSQFVMESESMTVLATYGEAMPDAFSSDVNVGDADAAGSWPILERIYQINLDPKRLFGEPAVIEGRTGAGRVLLSLVHFDSPGDRNGALVLKNLLAYLVPNAECGKQRADLGVRHEHKVSARFILNDIEAAVNELIAVGQRNFLWFWRNDMLLQWRRGVRGLEYCTLYVMVNEIRECLQQNDRKQEIPHLDRSMERIRKILLPFALQAKHLLVRERFAMQNAHITYEQCDDPEIQALREELFAHSKSHGGKFKEVVDELDRLLYCIMLRQ